MCAILDANVSNQVFGKDRPEAGVEFFEWLSSGPGRLVLGRKLRNELSKTSARKWLAQAVLAGRVRNVSDIRVDDQTETLQRGGICQSDDAHIIALAQISNARLLYSNDLRLHQDFKNKKLIDRP